MYSKLMAALCGLALVAAVGCGGTDQGEPGTGDLDVQILGLTNGATPVMADVSIIDITLDGATDYAVSINYPTTEYTFGKVYAGVYSAHAEAKNADGAVIFKSVVQDVTIVEGTSQTLAFVLNQQVTDGNVTLPYFEAVHLDKSIVEQGTPIHITVKANGGEGMCGLTTLTGRFAVNPPWDPAVKGSFGPAGTFQYGISCTQGATASIDWTAPPVAGPRWIVLQVTDSAGNVAELGVDVTVDQDLNRSVGGSVSFNMAPTVTVTTRVLNDAQAATAYFNVLMTDTTDMTYEWTGDCGGHFLTALDGDKGVGYPDGTGAVGTSYSTTFKYEVTGTARDNDCTMTLTVKDVAQAANKINIKLQNIRIMPN